MSDETSWTPGELPTPSEPTYRRPDPGAQQPATQPQPPAAGWSTPDGPAAPVPPSPYQPAPAAAPANPYVPGQPLSGQPPATQPPYGPSGYGPPGYGPPFYATGTQPQGRDGVSIAALATGVVGLGLIPLVLGIVGLTRVRRNGTKGRGMAIAGIVLGGLSLVLAPIAAAVLIPVILNQRAETLHAECAGGDMAACDRLYEVAAEGSAEQTFADTCGGRTDGGFLCTAFGDDTYGDDEHLDALWDACESGDGGACEELYYSAEPGSEYELFGGTCGGRTDGSVACTEALDDGSGEPT